MILLAWLRLSATTFTKLIRMVCTLHICYVRILHAIVKWNVSISVLKSEW